MAAEEKLALLAGDLALVESIDLQLGVYRDDMQRDFAYRLGEVDNILHEMSARGMEYLDDTLRFGRIVDLFRQQVLKQEFERVVVADAPERIDRVTQELIDWMVDQDLRVWRTVTEQVESRRRAGDRRARPSGWPARSSTTAGRCWAALGQTARGVLQRHDHQREATQLAASVREAVTQATLLEAGAVGLGAVSMAILGSAAADVSGLFAASVLAGVGLWLLPRKRRQAKAQFRARHRRAARPAGDRAARRVPARARTQRPAHPRRAGAVQPLRPRRARPHPALRRRPAGIARASGRLRSRITSLAA